MSATKITRVEGTAIVLPGVDIDTDRIMPARFLKAVTFEGLEHHVFEDDRAEAARRGTRHPFDNPSRRGARILLAGANFGCGSSREHAPQALYRWGLRGVVAESFAEIFAGNSLMLGLVCVTAPAADLERLRAAAADAKTAMAIDLDALTVTAPGVTAPISLPDSTRRALMTGEWDATGLLLDRYDEVQTVAARLPYLRGFV
jgi:3-isopropylmalate/(R)-2-methylmalate dehydratase small subunit